MQKIKEATLTGICAQMASHRWSEAEINELIDPQLGIITGLQDLLNELIAKVRENVVIRRVARFELGGG